MSVTRSLSLVQLHSGSEVRHLPRPELLSRCHIDQILHHCVTGVKQGEWIRICFYSAEEEGIASLEVHVRPMDVNVI